MAGIKVRAKVRGFYKDNLREPGTKTEEFTIKSMTEFSKRWMELVEEPKSEVPKGEAPKGTQQTEVKK